MTAGMKPAPSLVGRKLSANAQRVRDSLTDADLATVMQVKKASVDHVLQTMKIESNREVVCAIMALNKAKVSETDFSRMYGVIKSAHPAYDMNFLKGARDLCRALLSAREAEKNVEIRGANCIREDGYDAMVAWAENRLDHLNREDPKLYRHGSHIARVSKVSEEDSVTIKILDRDGLAAYFPAQFVERVGDNATRPVAPPVDVMTNLFKRADELPLPYLAGIARIPVFGERGQLHTTPGYDSESMVFYAPPADLSIKRVGGWEKDEDARQRELHAAKIFIVEELLADFPFDGWSRQQIMDAQTGKSDDPLPASMMNALGALLEPFLRAMIGQATPALLVTKPAAGTDETYFVNALQLVASGRANTRSPLSAQEEERQKVLAVAVESAEPIILFDNQKKAVDSPTLAALLTSTVMTARTLGRSEERSIPVRSTIAFTTNNARFSEELLRRLSMIRLDTKMLDPKARTGYRHADLHEWIVANRGKLVWAVLTLVANWVHGGCQAPRQCPPIPSYLGWAYVLGGILEAADPKWTQFQANRNQIATYASAGEEEGIEALISAWYEADKSMTASELATLAEDEGIEVDGVRKNADGAISGRSLAQTMSSFTGRRFLVQDGRTKIEVEVSLAGMRKGTAVWKLERAADGTVATESEETGQLADREATASAAHGDRARMPQKYRHFPLFQRVESPVERGVGSPKDIPPSRTIRRGNQRGARSRGVPAHQNAARTG